MRGSGFAQLLLLVVAALIVLAVVSHTTGTLPGLWARLTGEPPAPAPAHEITTPRPMTTDDGLRQVEQARRAQEVMDSLANSVRQPPP